MKTIGKFLVSLGVLMGSLGFAASAQGPQQMPGQKGRQIQNVGKPAPQRGKVIVVKPAPMPQNGRRANAKHPQANHRDCPECFHYRLHLGHHCHHHHYAHLHR